MKNHRIPFASRKSREKLTLQRSMASNKHKTQEKIPTKVCKKYYLSNIYMVFYICHASHRNYNFNFSFDFKS